MKWVGEKWKCFMIFSSDRIALKLINYSRTRGWSTLHSRWRLIPGKKWQFAFRPINNIMAWPCCNRLTRKNCFTSTCGLLIIGIKLNRSVRGELCKEVHSWKLNNCHTRARPMLKHGKWKCVYTLVDSGQTNKLSINSGVPQLLDGNIWMQMCDHTGGKQPKRLSTKQFFNQTDNERRCLSF